MAIYDIKPSIYEANNNGSYTYRWSIKEIQIPLGMHPEDNQTTTTITPPPRRSRFAVTIGAGVAYTPKGVQPYVGLGAGVILWQR